MRAHGGGGNRGQGEGLDPPRLLAGHGDEPVETQALVAAGRGITLTHDLTVIVNRHQLVTGPLARETGVRHVAVAYAAGPMNPAAETVLHALRAIGDQRGDGAAALDRMGA